ncbi:transcriptional regulator [Streptomyces sp. NPDC002055]|uniref:winged helix-turn-helix domain-containing protein n=1 Tax=Streptomyces sp. NPDC002055 TaxID=3154534 RepID=UPI00332E4FB2
MTRETTPGTSSARRGNGQRRIEQHGNGQRGNGRQADGPHGDSPHGDGPHPRHALAPLLASPVRLSVVAALAAVDKAEFGYVRDLVEITDSALSKQASALEEAGWVAVEKGQVGRRPRTWLSLTEEGLTVYRRHMAALRAIAGPLA